MAEGMASTDPQPAACEVKVWHGPGHQSSTVCCLRGEHDWHEATYGEFRQLARWEGGDVFTGINDEPPDPDKPQYVESPKPAPASTDVPVEGPQTPVERLRSLARIRRGGYQVTHQEIDSIADALSVPVDREARIELVKAEWNRRAPSMHVSFDSAAAAVVDALSGVEGTGEASGPDAPALTYEQGWELPAEAQHALEWMAPREGWGEVRGRLKGACEALGAWLPKGTEPEGSERFAGRELVNGRTLDEDVAREADERAVVMQRQRDEARAEVERLKGEASAQTKTLTARIDELHQARDEVKRLRAAVPLSTETLRDADDALVDVVAREVRAASSGGPEMVEKNGRRKVCASWDEQTDASKAPTRGLARRIMRLIVGHLESQSPPSPVGGDGRARSEAAVKAAGEVIERMESRHPEDVIARAALSAAEEVDPSVPLREINGETPICGDCVTIGKPSCDVQGHGITQLAELVDSYSNPPPPPPAVGLTVESVRRDVAAAVDELVREDDYGPEDAQRRVLAILERQGRYRLPAPTPAQVEALGEGERERRWPGGPWRPAGDEHAD